MTPEEIQENSNMEQENSQMQPISNGTGKLPLPQLKLKNFPAHELALIFLVVFVSLLGAYTIRITPIEVAQTEETEMVADIPNPFDSLSLSAQGAYVWDIKNQKALYTFNADIPFPLASLTKIMTAITAVDLIPDYTVVTIKPEFLKEEGDSGLYGDERWKLKDLLDYSLVVSSNDGARAIAASAGAIDLGTSSGNLGREGFVARMNAKAKEINLLHTRFANENGLDLNTERGGAYGSARDMALLFEHILRYYPNIVEATKKDSIEITSLSEITHKAKNTNSKVGEIPGLLASKTGFTDLSGGNLVIAFNPSLNRPIVISVLGSTYEGRFEDILALVSAAMKYVQQQN